MIQTIDHRINHYGHLSRSSPVQLDQMVLALHLTLGLSMMICSGPYSRYRRVLYMEIELLEQILKIYVSKQVLM